MEKAERGGGRAVGLAEDRRGEGAEKRSEGQQDTENTEENEDEDKDEDDRRWKAENTGEWPSRRLI